MGRKVYFAGSIAGGRADADLYRSMIEHIQKTDTVLTEHVGDLSLSKIENVPNRDVLVYEQDTGWLKESDLLIGEVSCPSLGVGYELAFAEKLGVPCHLFFRNSGRRLSSMIAGDPYFHIYPYDDPEEIFPLLDRILEEKA